MRTITFNSNFGRFAYEITAEIGEEVNEESANLCVRGLADTGFRGVSSDVEKSLVEAKLMTKEQKRGEVAFATATAALIVEKAQAKLDEIAKKGKLPAMSFRVTREHVFGEAGEKPTKEATERWTALQSLPTEKFERALKLLGLGEDYTDEQGILAVKKHLNDAKERAAQAAKAALEGAIV